MEHQDFPAYNVSTDGSVTNVNTGRTLKPEITQNGYMRVTLCAKGRMKRFLLHRLVAIVHIENPQQKPCVNHIDGDKANNKVSNLEWCTFSENESHSYSSLGKVVPSGVDHYNTKLTQEDRNSIVAMRRAGETCRSIASKMGLSHQHVSEISRGRVRG
jgi:hypothetical protein